jgi:anti-sigma regulatory factor (Ser/Thr protein kinase)
VDLRVTLPADPRSPAEARRLVSRSLLEWGLAGMLDAAALLITELVTNSVLHARSETELVVTADGQRLHVEVCDASPVVPRLVRHSLTAVTGRGIRLLDTLATGWGVVATGEGKCVWFALDASRARADASEDVWSDLDFDAIEPL